jgi:hypothetical protein
MPPPISSPALRVRVLTDIIVYVWESEVISEKGLVPNNPVEKQQPSFKKEN